MTFMRYKDHLGSVEFHEEERVRVGPELHRRAVIAAAHAGVSLNAFTTRALEAALADTAKAPRAAWTTEEAAVVRRRDVREHDAAPAGAGGGRRESQRSPTAKLSP